MTFPCRPRAGACRVWLTGSLTSRGFPVGLAAAPPPARLPWRDALGSPGGRRPRDLWLMVGGGRPDTRCPALVLQVLCQAGQRSTPPCFCVPLYSVGRHAVLPAGPLFRPVPPLVLALLSVVGVPAFPPRPPWDPRVAVGLAVQAARLHGSSVALPLGRGRPTRAAARVGFPGPQAAGCPPGRCCMPGPSRGPGRGLGDREMTVLRAAPLARLLGRGVAGAPVRRVSWPVGPMCRTLPEPGGLGPRWGRWCGGARCQRAGRCWCRVVACAWVGGSLGGVYAGPAVGRSGVPWCGRGSGWDCVAAAWLAAGR